MKIITNSKIVTQDKMVTGKSIVFDKKIVDIIDDKLIDKYEYEERIDARGNYIFPGL